ncbi:MAG: hypothetical protein ACOZAA_09165 [Pseudomonadota bacterium]
MLRGPFAEKEETARKIAVAIISEIQDAAIMAKYDLMIESDEGSWAAFQVPKADHQSDPGSDTLYVRAEGGGVQMRIDKCSAAPSKIHLAR